MKKLVTLSFSLLLLLPLGARAGSFFVTGELGNLGAGKEPAELEASATRFMESFATDRLDAYGDEAFEIKRSWRDHLGTFHVRFRQTIDGLPVAGAEVIVHSDARGAVYAVNGEFAPGGPSLAAAQLSSDQALGQSIAEYGLAEYHRLGEAELTYVLDPVSWDARLAWSTLVEYEEPEVGLQRDLFFADAATGALITRHPKIYTAKVRHTYTANNGANLPGTLLCSNGQGCGDSVAQSAHNKAGKVYDYYLQKFGRDSLDDNGLPLISTVHYGINFNNAGWTGEQMVYGDGDGVVFDPLSKSLDVVAHELTHGVTEYTSGLIYLNESGALNEAMSDIFAAAVDVWNSGKIRGRTWKIGESVYTPAITGDALRYMNRPTKDGVSRDYYPERYTGPADNGGVHWNSGIANLAFKLMATGGTHPRGKTTVTVSSIGFGRLQQIFYRAQTTYLTPSATFSSARSATAQAAMELYNSTVRTKVRTGWCAVGVGGCP